MANVRILDRPAGARLDAGHGAQPASRPGGRRRSGRAAGRAGRHPGAARARGRSAASGAAALASGAIEGGSGPLDDAPDLGPTGGAGLPRAVVDAELVAIAPRL